MLIAVAQTAAFTAQAKAEGMSETEIENAITLIAANPTGGVSLGAGLYKVRVPREGAGKSGGYRVITLYRGEDTPLILLAVLSKGKAANFSAKAISRIKEKAREIKRPK